MDRVPALVALAVGALLVASPVSLAVGSPVAFPAGRFVLTGALALYGALLAVAGWLGRDAADHDRLLWALSAAGLLLVGVPLAGVAVGTLTWAIVAALAALVGGVPGVALLFTTSRTE